MAEDPELERRLEAMFASARPRRGFEDELWKRLQARRRWPGQLLGWFRAPAHLAPALAALLVVAGLGWLAVNFHPAGGATTTSSGGAAALNAPQARNFGVLPSLRATTKANAQGPYLGPVAPSSAVSSGDSVGIPGELPVYRYDEPSASELAAAGAALTTRSGLPVKVRGSDAASGVEPRFSVNALNVPVGAMSQVTAAQAFLGAHDLLPTYTYQVLSGTDWVVYSREFIGAGGTFPEVGPDGRPAGLEVDFSGGNLVAVGGPLELALANAAYPLRSVRSVPADSSARIVYALVVAGGHGYYEPERLVTGPAGAGLEPVIAPQWLGR